MLEQTTLIIAAAQSAVPSADIVTRAGQESGWVAMLFAGIVLAGFGLLGWFVRQIWMDLRELQRYVRDTLTTLVARSHEQMNDVMDCMSDVRKQLDEVIQQRQACDRVIERLGNEK